MPQSGQSACVACILPPGGGSFQPMARAVAWVVYPDRVEKVEIVRRGANEKRLVRPVKNPVTVEDEHGDQYVVPLDQLYNDPIGASVRQAEYAQQFGTRANPAETEDEELDSDSDDELDCGCEEGESCEECEEEESEED